MATAFQLGMVRKSRLIKACNDLERIIERQYTNADQGVKDAIRIIKRRAMLDTPGVYGSAHDMAQLEAIAAKL